MKQIHTVITKGGTRNFSNLRKAVRYSIQRFDTRWEIITTTLPLLLLLVGNAGATELTYSSQPNYADRSEQFVYKAIHAQASKHAPVSFKTALAIDGEQPVIQLSSDEAYRDLVQAVIKGGR